MAKSSAARELTSVPTAPANVDGRGALHLDRVIHEQTRLAIVSALAVNKHLTFSELKRLLDVTDGNLSIHARKIEDAGYVSCVKTFVGRVPKTTFSLTAAGRKAFEAYLEHMEAIIKVARKE